MAAHLWSSSSDKLSSCTSSDESLNSSSSSTTNPTNGRSLEQRKRGRKNRKGRVVVWVGNLSSSCTLQQLLQHFSDYKSFIRNKPKILTPKNKEGSTQRYTLLNFDNMKKASEVIQAMNNSKLLGRKIIVNLKKEKHSHKSSQSEVTPLTVDVVAGHVSSLAQDIISEDDSDDDNDSVFSSSTTSSSLTSDHSNIRRQIKYSVRVSNLPSDCTSQQLLNHFSSYKSAFINKKIKIITPKSKTPFAFLNFHSLDKANEVIKKMDKTVFQEKKLTLKLQKTHVGDHQGSHPGGRPTTNSTSDKKQPIVTGGSNATVSVINLPSSMDCSDLHGLVAQFQPLECFIDGQKGTLKFLSTKKATEAMKFLNNKFVYGVYLKAVVDKSLLGEPIKLPGIVCSHGGCQRGKKTSDPSPVVPSAVQYSDRERHSSHGHPVPLSPPMPFMLSPGTPMSSCGGSFGPTVTCGKGLPLCNFGPPHTLQHSYSRSSSVPNENPMNIRDAGKSVARKRQVYNRRITCELYSMFLQSEEANIKKFKSNGVTIDYIDHSKTMIVCGPPGQVDFTRRQFERYEEKQLRCSSQQWADIQDGKLLKNDLLAPFQYNPAMKIIEHQSTMTFLIVGLRDAVQGAHQYLFKVLNKSIKAESSKLSILIQLQPTLPDLIHSLYGVTITGYTEGSSTIELQEVTDDANKVHQLVGEMLSSLSHTTVPFLPSPLVESAKRVCSNDNISVAVRECEGELVLWCMSPEALAKARDIFTNKPYINKVDLTRFNEACMYLAFSEKFSFQFVTVRIDGKCVVLEGFTKQDVQAAKKVVLKFLKDSFVKKEEKVVEELLCCTDPQLAYLTRSMQSDVPDELTKGLSAEVSIMESQILIKGTRDEVKEASESLLDSVPLHSVHLFNGMNLRFIPLLLKQHVLISTDHIMRIKEERKDKTLTVYLFNNNQDTLTELKKTLNALDPHVLFFTVSPKSKTIVKKILGDLERQERCHIDLLKHDTPKVAVHGLTREERSKVKAAIKDYVDDNYVIIKQIPSPSISGLQMKYIVTHHGDELKELAKNLKQCHIPFQLSQKSSFDFSPDPDVFIKVVGTFKAINVFDESFATFSKGFTVEQLQISIPNVLRYPWCKRWNALKEEFEDLKTILEYRLPRREEQSSIVSFLVYGTQPDGVAQLKDTIESEVLAGTVESTIKLSNSSLVGKVQGALKDKQLLNFDDYLVEVKCVQKDELIYINSLAASADCIELVKTEIKGFVECTDAGYKEMIEFDDSLVYVTFCSRNFSYYNKALSIGKRVNVSVVINRKAQSICLSGRKALVDVVKNQINMLIHQIRASIDSKEIIVSNELQCALVPSVKVAIERKLLFDSCIQVTYAPQKQKLTGKPMTNDILKKVLFQLTSDSSTVELTLCKTMLTALSTEVIVVPVTPDLQHLSTFGCDVLHRGGVALQKECSHLLSIHGPLAVGEVVSTGSGVLQSCKQVIHAVTPEWAGGENHEKENLYTAVFNSLSESVGCASICLPALGCESPFNIPHDFCAGIVLKAIRDFYYCHPINSLKRIVIMLLSKQEQIPFLEALPDVFPSDSFVSSDDTASLPQWFWKNDNNSFSPYSTEDCLLMESAYQQSPTKNLQLKIGSSFYTIDFQSMVQWNPTTLYRRDIKRDTGGGGSGSGGGSGKVFWYWINDTGRLTPYTCNETSKLEAMYRLSSPGMMCIGGQFYQFNFSNMTQTNIISGSVRHIQRKMCMKISDQRDDQSFQNKSISSNLIVINLRGPKDKLLSCEQEINEQLRQSIREEQILIPFTMCADFMSKVTEIASKHSIVYELRNSTATQQGKRLLVIRGVDIDRAVNELQRYIIEQQNASSEDLDIPPEWHVPQTNTTELFSLDQGSREWIRVEQRFHKTMPTYHVKDIVRIQNLYLWEKWIEERNRIEKFKNCVNEMELFHGTGKNDPNLIYDSEIGFDMRFCSSGMWGQANYFAVNASYSHNYSHTNPASGLHEMFLVRLITGDSYQSEPNKSLRMPPLKIGSHMGLSQVRYDTVNGTTRGSQVFMSYDNQKAYPAYLIKY